MKKIALSGGEFAIVDNRDYERLSPHHWRAKHDERGNLKNVQRDVRINGKKRAVLMHHEVIGHPLPGMEVDHENRNPLDNRRKNLRFCTSALNKANSRKRSTNTSGFKGVVFLVRGVTKPWAARIQVGDRIIMGGRCFATAEEAARRYDELATKFHGPFAHLNFPK